MMDAVVVLPVLDPAAAVDCVATMAPVLRERLLVIDQGVDSARGMLDAPWWVRPEPHRRQLRPTRNIGIARCVNTAVAAMRAEGAAMLVWVSTSMRFAADGGELLITAAERAELGVIGRPAQMHAFALRSAAFDAAGLWDENFYPAYYEDTDWRRRLQLATGNPDPLDITELPGEARDGHGYDVLRAAMPGKLPIDFDALKGYYAAKWGGCPPESVETFDLPWGDRPLDWWPAVSIEELIDRYRLGR